MQQYQVAKYYDNDTNRYRWAVLGPNNVYYFPSRYGYKPALALCNKLNRIE